jgi:hypothetical protein
MSARRRAARRQALRRALNDYREQSERSLGAKQQGAADARVLRRLKRLLSANGEK